MVQEQFVQPAPVYQQPVYAEEQYEQFQPPYVEEQYQDDYDDQYQYEDEIEPTETDIDDEADLDEGTVVGARAMENSNQYSYKPQEKYYAPPKRDMSPEMKVKRAPLERDWRDPEPQLSKDEWKHIQKKIDKEYEKKLKMVSDDAMNKLQAF
jgi:hypothetical protein